MRRNKDFKKTKGYYYFNIIPNYNNSITIYRSTREKAEYAFSNYLKQKKRCEWLGQWDGKKFVDTEFQADA